MNDIVSAMDALKITLETESALRQATNVEWANGNQHGPMRAAHDACSSTGNTSSQVFISLAQ